MMVDIRRRFRQLGAMALTLLAVMAWPLCCAAAEQSGTLRVAVASFGFETFMPGDGSIAAHVYWDPIYDYMFYRGDKGALEGGLISSWKTSDDGLTYDFSVRQGVKWHNGRELDAEDIAFNFKYWITSDASKHNTTSVVGPNIASYKVTDKYAIEIKLKRPQPQFLDWLSDAVSAVVVPREYGTMDPKVAREHPIGTGPWKFSSRSLGENVVFEAVPHHWRHTPQFKQLELKLVPEPSTRLAMLRRGEVDIIDLPLSFKKEVQGLPFKVVRAQDAFSAYMFFTGMYRDASAPAYDPNVPWRKKEVREALNLAIDRQAIADHVFQGEARPAVVPLPLPSQSGYDTSWKPYPYDPEKAKKLLADAGYPNGFAIKLMSYPRPGVPDIPLMIEAIADYWSRIGITTTIEKTEWAAIRPKVRGRQVKDFVAPDTQGPVSPDIMAFMLGDPFYYFDISDVVQASVDAIKDARTEPEMETAITKMGNAMIDEYALLPIALLNQTYVVNPKTVGDWPVHAHQGGPNSFDQATKP